MVLSLEKDAEHYRTKFESEKKRNDLMEDDMRLNRLTDSLVKGIDSRLGEVSRNLRRLDGGQDAVVIELHGINTRFVSRLYYETTLTIATELASYQTWIMLQN